MLVTDYIKKKFQSFGIQMSEADLFDVWTAENEDDEISSENKEDVELAIVGFIPQLLIRPTSISEGDYKVDFNVQAMKDYYAFLCNIARNTSLCLQYSFVGGSSGFTFIGSHTGCSNCLYDCRPCN